MPPSVAGLHEHFGLVMPATMFSRCWSLLSELMLQIPAILFIRWIPPLGSPGNVLFDDPYKADSFLREALPEFDRLQDWTIQFTAAYFTMSYESKIRLERQLLRFLMRFLDSSSCECRALCLAMALCCRHRRRWKGWRAPSLRLEMDHWSPIAGCFVPYACLSLRMQPFRLS